jgi:hypothetical protein
LAFALVVPSKIRHLVGDAVIELFIAIVIFFVTALRSIRVYADCAFRYVAEAVIEIMRTEVGIIRTIPG